MGVAPPSDDFVLRGNEIFESDNGQIDDGPRYSVLLQVLVDFLASDGGTSLPKDGLEQGGVEAKPAAGESAGGDGDGSGSGDGPDFLTSAMLCRPCKL